MLSSINNHKKISGVFCFVSLFADYKPHVLFTIASNPLRATYKYALKGKIAE